MSNEYMEFPDDVPEEDLFIYWDKEQKKWHIWFGEDAPMFEDSDFSPFREKLFRYKMVKK